MGDIVRWEIILIVFTRRKRISKKKFRVVKSWRMKLKVKNIKYGVVAIVIFLLLGTGFAAIRLDTKGATSQKESESHSDEISDYENEAESVNEQVDLSNVSYESNVEILDEVTFKDEIEMNAQNGEEASDVNEEEKNEKK